MKTNIVHRFYILSAGFNAARMGIGATSVIYMLSFGLSLGDIATIKIIQGLVIFFAEVPTGLIADTFGRRASVLAACLASLLSFAIFMTCDSVLGFSIAEIFNGLCIAFWSGAFEALVVQKTEAVQQPGNYIETLFAKIGSMNALATMVGGLVGGFLGQYGLVYPFYLAAGLMILVLLYTYIAIPTDKVETKGRQTQPSSMLERLQNTVKKIQLHHKNAWTFSLSSPSIRVFFIIQILIQFSIQPALHYWQPYFFALSNDVTTKILGWVFFGYVGGQFIFSELASRLLKGNRTSFQTINSASATTALLSFTILIFSKNFYFAALMFVFLQSALGVFRNNIGANFNRIITENDRATVLSAVSFVSRLGMLINLVILKFSAGHFPVSWVFVSSALGMAAVIPLVLQWNRFFGEKASE